VTSPSLAFRPYGPEDLPALQRIRQAAFAPVFRSFAQVVGEEIAVLAFARADEEQARLLDALCGAAGPDRPVLVAVLGGAVVGFVCFSTEADGRVGEIGLNAVHPDHAGRGIGTEMVRRVLARLKARGAALATVSTGGDPGHAPARRAYEKAGFGAALPSVSLYRLL
jgi:ribosomal protein S18 acetylase RimI-like enzyme